MNNKDINTWFHHLGGKDLFKKTDEKFVEYRKKWQEWPKTFDIGNFPLFIDIEVTNVCNLKCPWCVTTISGKKDKKGFISKERVEKIIDEGKDNGLYGIKFNIRGEPLLHPSIDYFVEYAKRKGMVDVYFNTNAVALTERISNKLIDAGLDRISISFEGCTKEIYEKNRVGANFELVLKNIESLINIKNKLNIDHPKIRIQTIKLPEIDIEEYGRFWKEKVDEVSYLDYKDMGNKKKGTVSSWVCPQLWQRMAVLWNGDIFPCNHDDEQSIKLGNIDSLSIKDGWESLDIKRFRYIHRQGLAHTINACDGCYLRNIEINKIKKKE